MAAFTTKEDVRAYLGTQAAAGKFVDAQIDAAIAAASSYLETQTGRQFEAVTESRSFTTNGLATIQIPDLTTATTVNLDGTALTAKETYWLIPDARHAGVYTAIQIRPHNRYGAWNPSREFDYGTPPPGYSTFPNDLEIAGDWGYTPIPDEVAFAAKVLAAFYVLRPDSVLGNVSVTAEGTTRVYNDIPLEVRNFLEAWSVTHQAALV